MDALKCCDTLYAQSQLLGILASREGLCFTISEGTTVKDRLEKLLRYDKNSNEFGQMRKLIRVNLHAICKHK